MTDKKTKVLGNCGVDIKEALKKTFLYNIYLGFIHAVPDWIYVKVTYHKTMGKRLNLRHPQTFSEKLCHNKIYDRNPLYPTLVDKLLVRDYVRNLVGEQYLTPLYATYESEDEIDFEKLPDSFVLKTTHDSGSVILCKHKNDLDFALVRRRIGAALRRNYYYCGREWPYKKLKPKIMCEKMLADNIMDWKFYVFHGKVKYLYLGRGLVSDHSLKIRFYDGDFKPAPFGRMDYPLLTEEIQKPENFEEMKRIASVLSNDLPFVRVDLYNVDGKIYFSEITLTPASGLMPLDPPEHDTILGQMI